MTEFAPQSDEWVAAGRPCISVINLTKEGAEQLFARRPSYQRPLAQERVAALARAMSTPGEWRLAPDAIMVERDNGHLLNGQHRVKARIEADTELLVPVLYLVVDQSDDDDSIRTETGRSLPASFPIMDTGRARSWSQFVQTMGVERPQTVQGAIATGHAVEANGGFFIETLRPTPTNMQRWEWYQHQDKELILALARQADSLYRKIRVSKPMWVAFGYLASRDIGPDLWDRFVQIVAGNRLPDSADGGAYKLKERIAVWSRPATGAVPKAVVWNTIARAWHAHLADEQLGNLRWALGDRPLPVVPAWLQDPEESQ